MQNINPRKRRMSRRFAMQAIYQWLLTGNEMDYISRQFTVDEYARQMDVEFFNKILNGVLEHHIKLCEILGRVMTKDSERSLEQVDPIERSILLLGTYEFAHCYESPYRVVINEAIELAKIYGAEDSFKYINAVLDKLMPSLRPVEWRSSQSRSTQEKKE
jgi:transcription antitermination protein NusB